MTVFPFRWLIFQLKSLTHKTLFVTLWQFQMPNVLGLKGHITKGVIDIIFYIQTSQL